MAGFNQNALEFSLSHLEEQKKAILDTLPYIVDINVTKASSGDQNAVDLYADYIKGIDGHAYDMNGKDYTVSFKSRLESGWSQDLRLEAIRLTDDASLKNNKAGFIYNEVRYAFEGYCDINVQWINRRNYVFLGSELQALSLYFCEKKNELVKQIKPKKSKDRDGREFFSGRYYVFLDTERFCTYINWLSEHRTSYQCQAGNQND